MGYKMNFWERQKQMFIELRDQFRAFKGNIGAYWNYGGMLREEYDKNRRLKKWEVKKKKD